VSAVQLSVIISLYFAALLIISVITGRKSTNLTFFLGNRRSPWYVVAFGMIGASLSGVTFISVPGEVGASMFTYMQIVLGYLLGYILIANILLPLYYKLNLTSIYVYLQKRFGNTSYRTGSFFFIISRIVGASFRLYLVAMVLDRFVLSSWGIPFWYSVAITIILIWIYSFRAGIKTIIWTDTLQTFFMLAAVGLSIYFISMEMNLTLSDLFERISESRYSRVFIWDWRPRNNFFKYFFSGAFISIVMTGLDQDMMQKNLSCRNIGEAKKNMYWMSSSLIVVNMLFLMLGALLYIYAGSKGVIIENFADPELIKDCPIKLFNNVSLIFECEKTDQLFPFLALRYMKPVAGIAFTLGLVAAAYSSADSALTALTTSFCVDFLGFKEDSNRIKIRYLVHIGFSVLLFLTIIIFRLSNNESVINSLFTLAGYTYGPLLGLYSFGLFTKLKIRDRWVPLIAFLSPLLCGIISLKSVQWFNGYEFGFELLVFNGLLTFLGLLVLSLRMKYRQKPESSKQ
jgi:Na+/proline symporter